jgi:transcriptional regulator
MEKARELLYSERNSIMWSTTILAKVSFLCDRGSEFSNYVQLVNAKRDEQEMLRQGLVKPDTIFQELLINSPYVVNSDKMNAWIKALQ